MTHGVPRLRLRIMVQTALTMSGLWLAGISGPGTLGCGGTPPTAAPPRESAERARSVTDGRAERAGTLHAERPDDPPLPRPATSPETAPRRIGPWRQDAFESVQVNVDALGQNIPSDAANEPSIAVDPTNPDRMVIGWRQFDNVASNFRQAGWAYSHDGGRTWTFPGVLEPGVFSSDPVLDVDADGNFYYYSLQSDRGPIPFACYLYKSFDGGLTWPHEVFARGGDKAWMTVDRSGGIGHGHVYAVFDEFDSPDDFTRSTDGGLTFSESAEIFVTPWGTLTVGPDGELYVSGRGIEVARSDNARDATLTPTFQVVTGINLGGSISFNVGGSPNPGGLLGQVWIDCDRTSGPNRGNVYLLASVNPPGSDPLDVMFARSTDGGETWSAPVRINEDPPASNVWQWFGTMSVAPSGRIDVIWNDTRDDPTVTHSQLYYSNSLDAGLTWLPNTPLSPPFNHYLGYPNQAKLGDYYDMVSTDVAAYVAYAATFNGEQDVYFLRISFDCNSNGVPDYEDVAGGTSQDCTSNGTPDECEPDCNTNGTADSCDIATGTSHDCAAEGIPDECEPDCNGNGIADSCDVHMGTSSDCLPDGVPDDCEPDCNTNGVADACDLAGGSSADCNANGIPDECDITSDTSQDCTSNGLPDECEPDCNTNGVADSCDIGAGTSLDCTGNGTLDDCEADCNTNGIADTCDMALGTSTDCQPNGTLDECDLVGGPPPDHNCCEMGNGPGCSDPAIQACVCALDLYCCQIAWDTLCAAEVVFLGCGTCQPHASADCNDNRVPDECDVAVGTSQDCSADGTPDECQPDCNTNGIGDNCDILFGSSDDCNSNAVPDDCEPDCNGNDIADGCELAASSDFDCTSNGVLDSCDIAAGVSDDCDANGIPDECDAEICYPLWDGFEPAPPFAIGTLINGIDYNGDGSAWSNPTGTSTIGNQGCPAGSGKALKTVAQTPPTTDFTQSEYLRTTGGTLGDGAPLQSLTFDVRSEATLNPRIDWQLSIRDATNDQSVILVHWASTQSSYPGVGSARGRILVKNPSGSPAFISSGFAIPANACYKLKVTVDNFTGQVRLYINGTLRVTTTRLDAGASRMDYFRLEQKANGQVSGGVNRLALDNLVFCQTGGVLAPGGLIDCNANGVLDRCDITAGAAGDCDPNGVPDSCEHPGDFDCDGDVDSADADVFRSCFSGSGHSPAAGCGPADLDADGDVDCADWSILRDAWTAGPLPGMRRCPRVTPVPTSTPQAPTGQTPDAP